MSASDSSLSSLSPPPDTDEEMEQLSAAPASKRSPVKKQKSILSFCEPVNSTSSKPTNRKKRPASPPHEETLADNPDIAFIVMFRSRFSDAFPAKCPNVGPQDLERGVTEPLPSSQIESLLCALLGLVLNRKKPVEKGHYGRALEEAIQTQKHQWPREWNGVNPLSGSRTFNMMDPKQKLALLRALILWSLHNSEVVHSMIQGSYKSRTSKVKEDINIPLSVQPWGRDGDKRRYFLIEGRDDTYFRVYRESNPYSKNCQWYNVAGSIDELHTLSKKLKEENTKEGRALSDKIDGAIPRFEATEEKRKRREYRMVRKAQFAKPEPGFSLYEGRTRGKRMRYTFSDDEGEDGSDAVSVRRSGRSADKPAASAGPTVTASGRQVRSRLQGLYGEALHSGQTTERASPATGEYVRSEGSEEPRPNHSRTTRANIKDAPDGWGKGREHIETYNSVDEMDDEDDASSSGHEWDGGDEEDDANELDADDSDDVSEDASDEEDPKTLVIVLKYNNASQSVSPETARTQNITNLPNGREPTSTPPAEPSMPESLPISVVPSTDVTKVVELRNGTAPVAQVFVQGSGPSTKDISVQGDTQPNEGYSAPTPPYGTTEDPVAKKDFAEQTTNANHSLTPMQIDNPTPAPSL